MIMIILYAAYYYITPFDSLMCGVCWGIVDGVAAPRVGFILYINHVEKGQGHFIKSLSGRRIFKVGPGSYFAGNFFFYYYYSASWPASSMDREINNNTQDSPPSEVRIKRLGL